MAFNPLKEFIIVGRKIVNLGVQHDALKKNERSLLEETTPWHTLEDPNTLTSTFSFLKNYIFVVTKEEGNVLSLEPNSVLPILFWHRFEMNKPDSDGSVPPILWLAGRPGNVNAIKRMVYDGTRRCPLFLRFLTYPD